MRIRGRKNGVVNIGWFSHGQRVRFGAGFRIDGGVDGGGRGLTGAKVAEKGPCRCLQASLHDEFEKNEEGR